MGRILPSFARAHIAFTRTGYAWNELNEGKQRDADCGTTSRHHCSSRFAKGPGQTKWFCDLTMGSICTEIPDFETRGVPGRMLINTHVQRYFASRRSATSIYFYTCYLDQPARYAFRWWGG